MRIGLLAEKIGMSRFYDSAGLNHPVTLLKVEIVRLLEVTK